MKHILLILPLLFISSCSQDMFTLICKFNAGSLYTDTLTFNESKSEVLRTSDNRNYSPFSYNARNTDDGYILYGTYYKTDSNGNKTLIEDEDMWVLTKNAPANTPLFGTNQTKSNQKLHIKDDSVKSKTTAP